MSKGQTSDIKLLLEPLRRLHESVRDSVVAACQEAEIEQLSRVEEDIEAGDTIYAIDRISENLLMQLFEREIAVINPIILIGEGLPQGRVNLPRGTPDRDAVWRIIVDPIDGTRELMYQKRSAWILTGVAPNLGDQTGLQDILLAIQTEIPTLKQHLCDTLWALLGEGAQAERFNRLTAERKPLHLRASTAKSISHGFAMVARFFPGAREELAAIDEEIVLGALGEVQPGKAHCFEDQYLSSGGQLYELISGHYRFVADLRPLMAPLLHKRGRAAGICCHPYDICTELIARESGVIITGASGEGLDAPLDVDTDITWVGYANNHIREQIEPNLRRALAARGLVKDQTS